jgi:hypothetical protein
MKFDNFDDLNKFIQDIDNKYKNKYDNIVNNFNNEINKLINKINKAKSDFIESLNEKYKYKNILVDIIKNLYKFFYNEYSKITQSFDYPVLCMYQIINSELINFELDYPKETNSYLSKIMNEIKNINDSFLYNTKYQFSLKNFVYKKNYHNIIT